MGFTEEEIRKFHCPRWEELPSLSLYMDQVIIVLEEAIPLFNDDKERTITPTMVNNYVKQKLVHPPVKKKYDRSHIALLIVVSILKKALSMLEITGVISIMLEQYPTEEAYNLFCQRLEGALKNAFLPEEATQPHEEEPHRALSASLTALIGKMQVQALLSECNYYDRPGKEAKEPKDKKEKQGKAAKEAKAAKERNTAGKV